MDSIAFIFLFSLSSLFQCSFATRFDILSSPVDVKLKNIHQISLNDISSLPRHLFGLTTEKSLPVEEVSFLRRPSLFALFTIHGKESPSAFSRAAPLFSADVRDSSALIYSNDIHSPRQSHLQSLGHEHSVTLDSANLDSVSHNHLVESIPTDASTAISTLPKVQGEPNYETSPLHYRFVAQLRVIQAIVSSLVKSGLLHDSNPDWLRFELHCDIEQCSDVLKPIIARWVSELEKESGSRAVIGQLAVQGEEGLHLVRRSLLAATPAPSPSEDLNLAADYDENFPVIFNIILWLVVVLALIIYAIGYAMWNIDPGKDGLVYRRSYARQKKD